MKIYPNRSLEKRAREAGAFVRVCWEILGPKDTQIAWMTCLQIDRAICIVQTFKENDGWTVLSDFGNSPVANVEGLLGAYEDGTILVD